MLAAGRTWNTVFLDKSHHFLCTPAVYRSLKCNIIFLCKIFDNLICTETLMTLSTIHQRIRKSAQMTGSHPCLWVHDNRTVDTYVVWALLYELLPPCLFDVVLQFHAEISVIPTVRKTSIDLRTRIYKSSCFT